jgi:hypothetical protein
MFGSYAFLLFYFLSLQTAKAVVFTLHALNTEKLNPPTDATSALVRFFINQHTIAKTTLSDQVFLKFEK